VIKFFEVISTSPLHIYHSALLLSPRTSIVRRLYEPYAHPLVRVMHGLPISWEHIVGTVKHSDLVWTAAWSPCSGFIAVGFSTRIEILDAVTLQQLHTFTHPRQEGSRWLSFSPDSRSFTQFSRGEYRLTTWDLQTGGRISVVPSTPNTSFLRYLSSAYSMDGKVVAVAHSDPENSTVTVISTYNILSGTHIYSHRVSEEHIVASIWTQGEFLRFATVEPRSITIWEVGFTSKHALAEIKSLPGPDDASSGECLFLPTLSRLAFVLEEAVLIWDSWDSKVLLNFTGDDPPTGLSFSSDGRFFICGTISQEIHLWKESPTGYVLHQKLLFSAGATTLLSPDGESIITFDYPQTQLRHTTGPIGPPSSIHTQPARETDFVLGFSPDKSFAATGRLGGNIATIVDLKSGDPRLIVNTGMGICGLGVTASTVVVVGEGKIITWNLPGGDCVINARANIHDSVRTVVFNHPPPPPGSLHSVLISPDFNHFVAMRGGGEGLDIYDMSTGKHVAGVTADVSQPWFTRDGREVWYASGGQKIIRGGGSDVIGLEPLDWSNRPSGGCLWESSRGHDVDDGWILDSRKKRLMWLPHQWRASKEYRVWDGRFLALLDRTLPEPVIIELEE